MLVRDMFFLIRKAYKYQVPKLITNGGPFTNTTGWTAAGSALSVSNSNMLITGNGLASYVLSDYLTLINWTSGKMVYPELVARVTNASCTRMELQIRDSVLGSIATITVNNPIQNQWYLINTIAQATSQTNKILIRLVHFYTDAATANGKVMEVRSVKSCDLTALFGASNEPTLEQINTVGKNKFDKEATPYYILGVTVNQLPTGFRLVSSVASTYLYVSYEIYLKPSTVYKFFCQRTIHSGAENASATRVLIYAGDNATYITEMTKTRTTPISFTTPADGKIYIRFMNTWNPAETADVSYEQIQLEEANATTYEPYHDFWDDRDLSF